MRVRCLVLLAALAAAGCSSAPREPVGLNADGQVLLAIRALESGQASQADQALARLEKARLMYQGEDAEYVTLLMAEARLVKGESLEGLAMAREVLDVNPTSPRANEVAGKALLQLGRFADAEQRFLSAQAAAVPGSADDRRLQDLIEVARGLQAYAMGEPALARRQWENIDDPQIRYQIDEAVRAETAR